MLFKYFSFLFFFLYIFNLFFFSQFYFALVDWRWWWWYQEPDEINVVRKSRLCYWIGKNWKRINISMFHKLHENYHWKLTENKSIWNLDKIYFEKYGIECEFKWDILIIDKSRFLLQLDRIVFTCTYRLFVFGKECVQFRRFHKRSRVSRYWQLPAMNYL